MILIGFLLNFSDNKKQLMFSGELSVDVFNLHSYVKGIKIYESF